MINSPIGTRRHVTPTSERRTKSARPAPSLFFLQLTIFLLNNDALASDETWSQCQANPTPKKNNDFETQAVVCGAFYYPVCFTVVTFYHLQWRETNRETSLPSKKDSTNTKEVTLL